MDHQYHSAAGFAQDLMKRGVCQCGVEMLLVHKEIFKFSLRISNRLHCQKFPVYNFSVR
jgi:hypothetical protein